MRVHVSVRVSVSVRVCECACVSVRVRVRVCKWECEGSKVEGSTGVRAGEGRHGKSREITRRADEATVGIAPAERPSGRRHRPQRGRMARLQYVRKPAHRRASLKPACSRPRGSGGEGGYGAIRCARGGGIGRRRARVVGLNAGVGGAFRPGGGVVSVGRDVRH